MWEDTDKIIVPAVVTVYTYFELNVTLSVQIKQNNAHGSKTPQSSLDDVLEGRTSYFTEHVSLMIMMWD